MVPKPMGEIVSLVTSYEDQKDVISAFRANIEDIFSHPKDIVTVNMVHISTPNLHAIREHLLSELLDIKTLNLRQQLNIPVTCTTPDVPSLLRKRMKENTLIEDIYILGMSINDTALHKDIGKAVIIPPTPPNNNNNNKSNNNIHLDV